MAGLSDCRTPSADMQFWTEHSTFLPDASAADARTWRCSSHGPCFARPRHVPEHVLVAAAGAENLKEALSPGLVETGRLVVDDVPHPVADPRELHVRIGQQPVAIGMRAGGL